MVYILLGEGFEEAEALVTADVLRRGGVEVSLTGIGGMTVSGAHKIAVRCDAEVENVSLAEGDMLVLPGGLGGVASIEGSDAAMALVRRAAEDDGVWLAAICAAPAMLGRRGIIGAGASAVCYPGMEGDLTAAGVTARTELPAVTDGKLITGRGPGAAFDFGLALLTALKGAETAESVRAGMHYGE